MHDESHPVFFAYRLPKYKNIIPISTSAKSTALLWYLVLIIADVL